MHVRMFNPTSIAHATNLAKLHEASIQSQYSNKFNNRSNTLTFKPTTTTTKATYGSNSNAQNLPTKPILSKAPRTYNAAEMADRRAKGLCMLCDEPFTPGHQLKHRKYQLLLMEMDDDDDEPVDEEIEIIEEGSGLIVNSSQVEKPQLSMNALSGSSNYQTVRVNGLRNKKLL